MKTEDLRQCAECGLNLLDGVVILLSEQLTEIADHIDAQAARIAELEALNNQHGMPDYEIYTNYKVFEDGTFRLTDLVELSVLQKQQGITRQLASESNRLFDELAALREQEPVAEIKWDGTDLSVQNVRDGFSFGVTKVYTEPHPAQVAVPDDVIDRIAPAIDGEGLNEVQHHCEFTMYQDRNRIRKALKALRLNSGSNPFSFPEEK